VFTKF